MSPVTQSAAEELAQAEGTLSPESSSPAAAASISQVAPADPTPAALDDALVADWLHAHPDFFDRHADVLSDVKLRHPHGGQAISLVERQVLMLRDRNKALELKMAELIRIGQENDAIGRRLQQLTQDLLQESDPARLPALLVEGLQQGFAVPQVAVRLWGVDGLEPPFGDDVSTELRRRIEEENKPYCGPSAYPEAAAWLPGGGEQTTSIALFALRRVTADRNRRESQAAQPLGAAHGEAFGLVVLGSDDAARFQAGMGTAFLERLAEIASASLTRLLS